VLGTRPESDCGTVERADRRQQLPRRAYRGLRPAADIRDVQTHDLARRGLHRRDHRRVVGDALTVLVVRERRMRADSGRLPQSASAQVRRHLGVLCDQSALDALDATWRVSLRAAILALLRNRAQHALNGLSGRLEIPPVQPHQQVESVALAAVIADPTASPLVIREAPAILPSAERTRAV